MANENDPSRPGTEIIVAAPVNTELSEQELESVAGGDTNIACGSGPVNAYQCGKKLVS
jgi:hypothetical protein